MAKTITPLAPLARSTPAPTKRTALSTNQQLARAQQSIALLRGGAGGRPAGGNIGLDMTPFKPKPKGAPSLLEQFGQLATGVPEGLMGFLADTAKDVAFIPRTVVDIAKGDLADKNLWEIAQRELPATTGLGEGLVETGHDIVDPRRFAQYSKEGTILGHLAGDIGNIAMFAAPAVGRIGGITSETASRIAAQAAEGATQTAARSIAEVAPRVAEAAAPRSISRIVTGTARDAGGLLEAVPAETAVRPIAPTVSRFRRAMAMPGSVEEAEIRMLDSIDKLKQMTGQGEVPRMPTMPAAAAPVARAAPAVPVVPGRGLAGLFERAGAPGAARTAEQIGQAGRYIFSLGEKTGINQGPAAIWTAPYKGIAKLSELSDLVPTIPRHPFLAAGKKLGGTEFGRRYLFRFTDKGGQYKGLEGERQSAKVGAQLEGLQPWKLAQKLKMPPEETRTAMLLADQRMAAMAQDPRFQRLADELRVNPEQATGIMDDIVKAMFREVDDERYIPRAENVQEYLDIMGGAAGPKFDRIRAIRDELANVGQRRTARELEEEFVLRDEAGNIIGGSGRKGAPLNPEQLNPETMPSSIRAEEQTYLDQLAKVQKRMDELQPNAARYQKIADAYYAAIQDLPEMTTAAEAYRQGKQAGSTAQRLIQARQGHQRAQRTLRDELDLLQRQLEAGDRNVDTQLAVVEKATNRVQRFADVYERAQRRAEATQGLVSASGEFEPGAPRQLVREQRYGPAPEAVPPSGPLAEGVVEPVEWDGNQFAPSRYSDASLAAEQARLESLPGYNARLLTFDDLTTPEGYNNQARLQYVERVRAARERAAAPPAPEPTPPPAPAAEGAPLSDRVAFHRRRLAEGTPREQLEGEAQLLENMSHYLRGEPYDEAVGIAGRAKPPVEPGSRQALQDAANVYDPAAKDIRDALAAAPTPEMEPKPVLSQYVRDLNSQPRPIESMILNELRSGRSTLDRLRAQMSRMTNTARYLRGDPAFDPAFGLEPLPGTLGELVKLKAPGPLGKLSKALAKTADTEARRMESHVRDYQLGIDRFTAEQAPAAPEQMIDPLDVQTQTGRANIRDYIRNGPGEPELTPAPPAEPPAPPVEPAPLPDQGPVQGPRQPLAPYAGQVERGEFVPASDQRPTPVPGVKVGDVRRSYSAARNEAVTTAKQNLEQLTGNDFTGTRMAPASGGLVVPDIRGITPESEMFRKDSASVSKREIERMRREGLGDDGTAIRSERGLNAKGEPITRKVKVKKPAGGVMTNDQFAEIINNRMGTEYSVDEALQVYMDAVRHYWDVRDGRASRDVIDRVVNETGLTHDQVSEVLREGKVGFETILSHAEDALDATKEMYDALPDEERVGFEQNVQTIKEYLAEHPEEDANDTWHGLLDAYLPEFLRDETSPGAFLMGRVPESELVDWLTQDIRPPSMTAITATPTPAMHRQVGRRLGEVAFARDEWTQAQTQLRREQAKLADLAHMAHDPATTAAQQAAVARASERLDTAAERLGRRETQAAEAPLSPGRQGPALSTRMRMAEHYGSLHQHSTKPLRELRRLEAKRATLTTDFQRIPQELERSTQSLLRETNDKAIGGIVRDIRRQSKPLVVIRRGFGDREIVEGIAGQTIRRFRNQIPAEELRLVNDRIVDIVKNGGENPEVIAALDEMLPLEHADHLLIEHADGADRLIAELADEQQAMLEEGHTLQNPRELFRIADDDPWLPADTKASLKRRRQVWEKLWAKQVSPIVDKQLGSMPADFRTMAANGRRELRALYEVADEWEPKIGTDAANVLRLMAEDVPTTLEKFADPKYDPVHLIGGLPTRTGVAGGAGGQSAPWQRGTVRELISEKQRKHHLAATELEDYTRRETFQGVERERNIYNEEIGRMFGAPAREVFAEEYAAHRATSSKPVSQNVVDEWAKAKGYSRLETAAPFTDSTIFVPDEIARQIRMSDKADEGMLLHTLRMGNRAFKTMVLPFSIRWQVGNNVGNAINAMVHGGVGPVELVRELRRIRKEEGGLGEIWRKEVLDKTPRELGLRGLARNENMILYPWDEKAPRTAFGRKVRQVTDASYRLNGVADEIYKAAVYSAKLKKGIPSDLAIKQTLRALGDFQNLTPFERRWVREVLPFYPWLRHQTQAMLRLPIEHPGRAAFLGYLAFQYQDDDNLKGILSGRLDLEKFGLGGYLNLSSFNPIPSPGELPLDPSAGIGFNISPVIKTPAKLLTGLNVDYLDQLTRPSGTGYAPPIRDLLQGDPGAFLYNLTGDIPVTRALRDLAVDPGIKRYGTGEPQGRHPKDTGVSRFQSLAGLVGVPFPRTLTTDEQKAKRKKQKLAELAAAGGTP